MKEYIKRHVLCVQLRVLSSSLSSMVIRFFNHGTCFSFYNLSGFLLAVSRIATCRCWHNTTVTTKITATHDSILSRRLHHYTIKPSTPVTSPGFLSVQQCDFSLLLIPLLHTNRLSNANFTITQNPPARMTLMLVQSALLNVSFIRSDVLGGAMP